MIVQNNTAHNSSGYVSFQPPEDHDCSDTLYWRGEITTETETAPLTNATNCTGYAIKLAASWVASDMPASKYNRRTTVMR